MADAKRLKTEHAPDLHLKTKIIMMGNPGSGKSTLQNLFALKALFESSPGNLDDPGVGVTMKWSVEPDPINDKENYDAAQFVLIDTPGLGDLKKQEECRRELMKAMQQDGKYIIVFVLRADGIRVQAEDVVMINDVLKSFGDQVGNNQFSVILNKMAPKMHKELEKDPAKKANLLNNIQEAMTVKKTNHIYLNPTDPDLQDKDFDEFKELLEAEKIQMPPKMRMFILGGPAVVVNKSYVTMVQSRDEQQKKAAQEAYNKAVAENNAKLKAKDEEYLRQLDEKNKQHAADMKKVEEEGERRADEARRSAQQRKSGAEQLGETVLDIFTLGVWRLF